MLKHLKVPVQILAVIWIVFIIDIILPFLNLTHWGIHPRSLSGLPGIAFSPFLHGGIGHIISNSIPLFFLSFAMSFFYKKIWVKSTVLIILFGGLGVWLFALNGHSNHIGASGLVFGYVTFLIAAGLFMKNIKAILVAVVIFFLYGGVLWGVLPTRPGVSWEGHLFGAIAGIAVAWMFRKSEQE